jgi:hypothetical protein
MDSSTERLYQMKKQQKYLGKKSFIRIPAIEGKTLTDKEMKFYTNYTQNINGRFAI